MRVRLHVRRKRKRRTMTTMCPRVYAAFSLLVGLSSSSQRQSKRGSSSASVSATHHITVASAFQGLGQVGTGTGGVGAIARNYNFPRANRAWNQSNRMVRLPQTRWTTVCRTRVVMASTSTSSTSTSTSSSSSASESLFTSNGDDDDDDDEIVIHTPSSSSVLSSSSSTSIMPSSWPMAALSLAATTLVCGADAGLLVAPTTVTSTAGLLPTGAAYIGAWMYMTLSGLCIAELTLLRQQQPRQGKYYNDNHSNDPTPKTSTTTTITSTDEISLLDVYQAHLDGPYRALATATYFFLYYAVLVSLIAQGGMYLLDSFFGEATTGAANASPVATVASSVVAFASTMALLWSAFPTMSSIHQATTRRLGTMLNPTLLLLVGGAMTLLAVVGTITTHHDPMSMMTMIDNNDHNDHHHWRHTLSSVVLDPQQQHPDQVAHGLPILFVSLLFQHAVPNIVTTQLHHGHGDRSQIVRAIVVGTALPLLVFLVANTLVTAVWAQNGDPMTWIGSSSSIVALLIVSMSVMGHTQVLADAWTTLSTKSEPELRNEAEVNAYESQSQLLLHPLQNHHDRLALMKRLAFIFVPAVVGVGVVAMMTASATTTCSSSSCSALEMLAASYQVPLDLAGAFGVSTLLLALPPFMVWKARYGNENENDKDTLMMTTASASSSSSLSKPSTSTPTSTPTSTLVPFGKLALGSMWKAAGTLFLEQGAEKLGIFDWIQQL